MTATSGVQTPPQFIEANDGDWSEPAVPTRRCVIHLIPEDEGGFSAVAVSLPGVASQGETEDEALDNVTEALEGAIEAYKQAGMTIPWDANPAPPKGAGFIRMAFPRG